MKPITIHVPERTYKMFREHAAKTGVSASELIRQAMEAYYAEHLSPRGSIFDAEPADLGKTLRALSAEDDLLEEMLG